MTLAASAVCARPKPCGMKLISTAVIKTKQAARFSILCCFLILTALLCIFVPQLRACRISFAYFIIILQPSLSMTRLLPYHIVYILSYFIRSFQ